MKRSERSWAPAALSRLAARPSSPDRGGDLGTKTQIGTSGRARRARILYSTREFEAERRIERGVANGEAGPATSFETCDEGGAAARPCRPSLGRGASVSAGSLRRRRSS